MAISDVQICNMALTHLGQSRINNLTDTSEASVLCNLYYETTRDEVLRSHEWNCALWYQSLAALASTDDDYLLGDYEEYDYQFQLPTNPFCLRVLEVSDYPTYPYEVVSGYLLTNLSTVVIKYIRRVEDPTKFDPLLVKAISYRLAAELAIKITNSTKIRDDMLMMYELQLNRAIDLDARESEKPQTEEYNIRDAKDA